MQLEYHPDLDRHVARSQVADHLVSQSSTQTGALMGLIIQLEAHDAGAYAEITHLRDQLAEWNSNLREPRPPQVADDGMFLHHGWDYIGFTRCLEHDYRTGNQCMLPAQHREPDVSTPCIDMLGRAIAPPVTPAELAHEVTVPSDGVWPEEPGHWWAVACHANGCNRAWQIPEHQFPTWEDACQFVNGRDGWTASDRSALCPDHIAQTPTYTLQCREPGCPNQYTVPGAANQQEAIALATRWTTANLTPRCPIHNPDTTSVRHQIIHSPDRVTPPGDWWIVSCSGHECRRGWSIPAEATIHSWPTAAASINGVQGWTYDGANAWCPAHQGLVHDPTSPRTE